MKTFQIMLSCAGAQAPLVEAFRAAAHAVGQVVVADIDPYAAAKGPADIRLEAPPYAQAGYPEWCLSVCEQYALGLWISLVEDELLVLEGVRSDLESRGCVLVGAPPAQIEMARDKRGYATALARNGLLAPQSQTLAEVADKLRLPGDSFIVKERRGRGSRGLKRVSGRRALLRLARGESAPADWVAQPEFRGDVFCIDVVNDLMGSYAGCLARKRLKMGAQETDVALTVLDPKIEDIARKLSHAVGHQGCMDVDLVEHEGALYVLDLNVRFGGSHIFSLHAGARVPDAMVAWRQGCPHEPRWLTHEPGVVLSRFKSVCRLEFGA